MALILPRAWTSTSLKQCEIVLRVNGTKGSQSSVPISLKKKGNPRHLHSTIANAVTPSATNKHVGGCVVEKNDKNETRLVKQRTE